MTLWHAVVLGVLQGVTEFLPVSSSGHLALAQMVIPGFSQPGVVFDAMLHAGTAAAVVAFERRQLMEWVRTAAGLRLLALLVVGTAATGIVAFPLRGLAEGAFVRPAWVGAALLVTGVVVLATRAVGGGESGEGDMRWWQAAVVGLAQGVAVFPGVSRSGATIATSLGVGLQRSWAARFSFLLSVPAIAGVTVLELFGQRAELAAAGGTFLSLAVVGAVCAGFTGYVALKAVVATVSSRVFHRFAWYALPLGVLVLVLVAAGVL